MESSHLKIKNSQGKKGLILYVTKIQFVGKKEDPISTIYYQCKPSEKNKPAGSTSRLQL